ncbi:MAG: ABC transporter substrate-binding protein [Okeania sp. SIO2C9]|uniref:ABC transporter substrate-binding protein n=1 Tax=Okeania sp. SIO2C9 TaxID=2607791 RepID=UPI0013C049AF|nr:ABC transporter substrate-binding protein [Okeania sp. SIO2C9]NEQ72989.1 ABC transporter substrate-binding protein [Okeania sp. SIO2C9]
MTNLNTQKNNYRKLAILCIVILIFFLSACRPAPSNYQSRIVVPTPSDASTFNYPLNQSAYNVFGYLYEGLIIENGITGELEPALAESWKVSDDGQTIIITLKEGLKWSDGEPLTADDVVFSYNEIYLSDKIPTSFKDILRIGQSGALPTVKKIDNRRIEFSTPEPFAPFIRYAGGLPTLPIHALKESVRTTNSEGELNYLTKWGTDTPVREIVGNGMYRLKSYTPNQRIILEKNPFYWRQDEQGNNLPYIENIVWQVIENTDNQLLNFRSGELDTIQVAAEMYPLLKREENRGQYTIYNGGPTSASSFISFNLNEAKNAQGEPFVKPFKSRWFNNKAFRQAIAYAINREAMTNNIYRGLGAPQYSPIPVTSPFYLSPEEGLKIYNYNPEKAKELLVSAGFKYNQNGELLDSEGNRVEFNLLSSAGRKVREQMATQINQDLAKIGIKVNMQFLSFNTYVERLSLSRDWEGYLGGFGGGGIEPHGGYNIWSVNGRLHTFNQGPQPGEDNIEGWKINDWEQEIDDLYIRASQVLDEEKRKEIYGQAQQIIAEELPFIYMVNPLEFEAIRNRIKGIQYTELSGGFWNLYELQISE